MTRFAHSPSLKRPDIWHLLDDHVGQVSNLCGKFGSKFGAEEFCYNLGLYHDSGKFTDEWQEYLMNSYNKIDTPKVGHSMYGAKLIQKNSSYAAMLIAGHHTQIKNSSNFKSDLNNFTQNVSNDEIDKKYKFSSYRPKNSLAMRMCFSALIDADRTDTEIFYHSDFANFRDVRKLEQKHLKSLEDYFSNLNVSNSNLNSIRQKVREDCLSKATNSPGFFSFTAPTGVGKTLSALSFALKHANFYNKDRIIAVMPFTSIIQQNTLVYKSILGKNEVLEHHSNIMSENDNKSSFLRIIGSQNWNFPIINTTFNQLFDSLLANRPSKLRKLHNIANSVIIIDEVQLLSVDKTHDCIEKLKDLKENFNCTIVFCTATPFDYQYLGLNCVELCDNVDQVFDDLNRVEYKIGTDTIENELNNHDQVLCVVNTKARAAQVFEASSGSNLFHLSGNMTPKHKVETLKAITECLKNNLPCKVIATQLIECGVDLDFPVVLTDPCPLPSLIQRAGRCNREGKLNKGKVIIFNPKEEFNFSDFPDPLYMEMSKKTSKEIKNNLDKIHQPSFCKMYFKDLHNRFSRSFKIEDLSIDEHEKKFNFEESARFSLIDENTIPVIANCDSSILEKLKQVLENKEIIDIDLRQQIQNHTVNINLGKKNKNESNIKPIVENAEEFLTWVGIYDPKLGIILE